MILAMRSATPTPISIAKIRAVDAATSSPSGTEDQSYETDSRPSGTAGRPIDDIYNYRRIGSFQAIALALGAALLATGLLTLVL